MTKSYEIIFILTPVLSDEQTRETVNSYRKLLAEQNAKIIHEESWGMRKLAYLIKKKHTGYYHLFQIESPGETIAELETAFKRDERVLRYISVLLDKYSLEYAERRRTKQRNKKDRKEEITI